MRRTRNFTLRIFIVGLNRFVCFLRSWAAKDSAAEVVRRGANSCILIAGHSKHTMAERFWVEVAVMNPHKVGSFLVLLLMACSRLVLAQGTYTQIDYPGAEDTICYGINAAGDISGSYASVDGRWHGFILSGGVYTTIDYPGSTGTYVNGLNDFGQIVGQTNSDPFVGFSYNIASQTFTQISYPGSSTTSPLSATPE